VVKKRGSAKWAWGLLMLVLVLNLGAAIVNAVSCPDAISTWSPCVP